MKTLSSFRRAIALALVSGLGMGLALAITPGCSSNDTPTEPQAPPAPTNVPAVPVPAAPGDVLPAESTQRVIGLSDALPEFVPMVAQLQMMQDDGSEPWITMNRHLTLACGDVLPEYSSDASVANRPYIDARPRLVHRRFWRKVVQVTLDPGSAYSQEETITYGNSTTNEQSHEFSQTIGAEVTAGGDWGAFSAEVTASFSQTTTSSEVHSVTFSEEKSYTKTYSVDSDPNHTQVYALWQLVDTFSLVDADTVQIDQSATMRHAHLAPIAAIEFPNKDVIYQSVTRF